MINRLFRNAPSKGAWLIFLLVPLLLIMLPNIYYMMVGADFRALSLVTKIAYLSLALSIICLPLTILNFKTYYWIGFFFLLASPIEILHLHLFKAFVSVALLDTILKSNVQEASELGFGYWPFILFYLAMLGIYAYLILKKIPSKISLSNAGRLTLLSSTIVLLILLFIQQFHLKYTSTYNITVKEAAIDAQDSYVRKFYRIFPIGLALKYNEFDNYADARENYLEYIKEFSFQAVKRAKVNDKEIYILVIGETSRYDHWQINGYKRETSPLLSKQANLMSYTNAISCANITSLSIPFIITRLSPDKFSRRFEEVSFLKAFKEAGFYTAWVSNQGTLGDLHQINDADTIIALNNEISFVNRYDENLLPQLDQIIKSNQQKILVVLHTMGSHFRYNFRYPGNFEHFKPAFKNTIEYSAMNASNIELITNTYDNTILYSDFILSSVIKKLEQSNAVSTMLFTSDHGENLCDDDKQLLYHGSVYHTKAEMQVPFFVWHSAKFLEKNSDAVESLKNNIHQPISASNIFYTMLDLANITYIGEDLEKSIASKNFKAANPRYVLDINMKARKYD